MAQDSSLSADVPPAGSLRRGMNRLFGGAAANVFRGMAMLALGSGIARLIGIATMPVITRLYSPEDFGVLSVFAAVVAILAPILTLRYVLALPLPRHEGAAMNLLVLSVLLLLGMTLLITLLLWGFGEALLGLVAMEVLAPWWWLIALGLVAAGGYEVLSMWATRRRAYKPIARTEVFQSAAGSFVKVGLGLLAITPLGLLIGQVVASGGGMGSLARMFQREFRANWKYVRLSRMKQVALRHRGFPVYRLPSQLFLIASTQMPVLLIASIYGIAAAGQFGIASAIFRLPLTLITTSISKAYYGEIAATSNFAQVQRITIDAIKTLSLIGLLLSGAIIASAPIAVPVMLGNEWEVAGRVAQILGIYLGFSLVSASISTLLNVLGSQGRYLVINFLRASLVGLSFWLSSFLEMSFLNSVVLYAVTMLIFQLVTVIYVLSVLRRKTAA